MNNLKFLATTLIIVIFSLTGYSQTKELGLRLNNLTDFSFIYKKEKSELKYIRHRFGIVNLGISDVADNKNYNIGLGYAIGIEKRKSINEKLMFIHGFEPQLAANISKNMIVLNPAIGYVLGFQYTINDDFYVSVETIPSLNGNIVIRDNSSNLYSLNAGFNSNFVALTIAYKFNSEAN